MKRFICFIIASALLLSGCAGANSTPAAATSEASPAATTPAVSDGVKMDEIIALVSDIPTTQSFTEEAVDEKDLQTIITAGMHAPSAMNSQPWHFSVITDKTVMQKIQEGMSAGMGQPGVPGGAIPLQGGPNGGPQQGMPAPAASGTENAPPQMPGPGGMNPGVAKAGMTDAPVAIVISCKAGSEFNAGLACQQMSVTAQLLGYGSKIISSPTIALNGSNQEDYKELLSIPQEYSAVAVLLIGKENTEVSADAVSSATTRLEETEVVTYIKP